MPHLILSTDEKPFDTREIAGPVVIGRGNDCDVSIHDILLSRRHCRITPVDDGWLVIDLDSRNGTHVNNVRIEQKRLVDGDVIRVGKIRIAFHTVQPAIAVTRSARPALPVAEIVDPSAVTVFGLSSLEPSSSTVPVRPPSAYRRPTPQPRPADPAAYKSDDVYSMIEQIVSSSWDSIYAEASRPLARPIPRPMLRAEPGDAKPNRPISPRVSFALQAEEPITATSVSPPVRLRRRPRRLPRLVRLVSLIRAVRMI